jgi:hypothetical protein
MQEPNVQGKEMIVLMEITMNNLLAGGVLDAPDFLARVDLLGDIGCTVLISNYSEYYRLTTYFRRYTKEMIGVTMGINNLLEIFNEKYYEHLEGGILENFGRLFRHSVRLYVYPMQQAAYERYLATGHPATSSPFAPPPASPFAKDVLITARNVQVAPHLRNLYQHLLENHYLEHLLPGRPGAHPRQGRKLGKNGPRPRRHRDQEAGTLRLLPGSRRGLSSPVSGGREEPHTSGTLLGESRSATRLPCRRGASATPRRRRGASRGILHLGASRRRC